MTVGETIIGSVKQKKNKDRGSAMVMVIVAIAFIGMLVAMVLYMAYANYMMKAADRLSKDNFYSAESALDIINVGLQRDISDCMAKAYVTAMQNSADLTTDDMVSNFRRDFITDLSSHYLAEPGYTTKYSLDHLIEMWKGVITVAAAEGQEGAFLSANDNMNTMLVFSDNYIMLQNLHVVYTDNNGYVSIINTDIRIETPDLNFVDMAGNMQIENYSIIANDSLVSDANNSLSGSAHTTVTGNVFGGYNGITLANQNRLTFKLDSADTEDETDYNLAAGSINLNNALATGGGFETDKHYRTYVEDVNINTAKISLDGETYVSDDMDISGKGSEVTLTGTYYGYGNSNVGSQGSSSILINGADSKLDFSKLEELMLSGHAYVGAMRYDADKDRQASVTNVGLGEGATAVTPDNMTSDNVFGIDDYGKKADEYDNAHQDDGTASIPQNKSDVMTGEAMSVKANQLLYLVPGDCIGFIAGTDKQVVTKNPMSYDDYIMLTETKENVLDGDNQPVYDENNNPKMENKYEAVRLSALWSRLGGNTYTNNYKAVFRRVNGSVMVYLYLDFTNDQIANDFYQAYYTYDPEGMANYVSSYVKEMSWPEKLKNSEDKLTLAGNAFDFDANTKNLTLISYNNDAAHADVIYNIMSAQEDFSRKYKALMHTASDDYTRLTAAQEEKEIFENLVTDTLLDQLAGIYEDTSTLAAAVLRFFPRDIDGKAAGAVTYPDDCNPPSPELSADDTHLIVTNGDVYLEDDYVGLILAGGDVYIRSGCNYIQYDAQKTVSALRAKKVIAGQERCAYEVLGYEGEQTYSVLDSGGDENDSKIKLVDLISYENWKKD